jgi:hypothetical protein
VRQERTAAIPKAIAEQEDNRVRMYRQADPHELAKRQLVAEFDLDKVNSWFAMSDAQREPQLLPSDFSGGIALAVLI